MATSSLNNIDPCLLTGFFRHTGFSYPGKKIHDPAPQGPGLPKHEPSVKHIVVSTPQLRISSVIICLDMIPCSVVLDLDDHNVLQYSGVSLLGCSEFV